MAQQKKNTGTVLPCCIFNEYSPSYNNFVCYSIVHQSPSKLFFMFVVHSLISALGNHPGISNGFLPVLFEQSDVDMSHKGPAIGLWQIAVGHVRDVCFIFFNFFNSRVEFVHLISFKFRFWSFVKTLSFSSFSVHFHKPTIQQIAHSKRIEAKITARLLNNRISVLVQNFVALLCGLRVRFRELWKAIWVKVTNAPTIDVVKPEQFKKVITRMKNETVCLLTCENDREKLCTTRRSMLPSMIPWATSNAPRGDRRRRSRCTKASLSLIGRKCV